MSTTSKISRIFAATATAALLAGCSASSDRFADYPSIATNSVSSKQAKSASVDKVETSPLSGDRVANARPSWQNAPSPSAGYTPPAPSYRQQAAAPAPSYRTQAAAPAPSYAPAQNGSVTVRPGQTMYSLARANGLTVNQLARANNIRAPYTLAVGQRLTVPGTSNPVSPRPTVAFANAPAPRAQVQSGSRNNGVHVVRRGETLYSLGRAYEMRPHKIAAHNGLSMNSGLSIGQRIRIPGNGIQSPVADSAPAPLPPRQVATRTPDYLDQAAPVTRQPAPVMQQETRIEQVDRGSGFRWPVRGRVISKFGSKPNNTRNEGINIAVPEGTGVRAAEAGVVAYAGNELKGYGNLVLIRHQNGWVTAYAHNSELMVKRGDAVRRGDVIARAGKTGSVKTPQVHFEVRQGATAVDPMKYLSSRTASY
ncbi:MAG: peptidoglycan DD-metalloendopeptidase family protein [Pseudomonadota bacterium]